MVFFGHFPKVYVNSEVGLVSRVRPSADQQTPARCQYRVSSPKTCVAIFFVKILRQQKAFGFFNGG